MLTIIVRSVRSGDFDSNLLEINHLRVFLVLIFTALNTSLQKVLIVY